jgi:SAM-dependent methyltransferase
MEEINCPLCSNSGEVFHRDKKRIYHICPECDLVFIPPCYQLSPAQEKSRYLEHENDPGDTGYRDFLRPVAEKVLGDFSPPARGLDFGCGTGSPLPEMLKKKGLDMDVFDPFFAPQQNVFEKKYDFITCTEVLEHLRNPLQEMKRLFSILAPGGNLYVKTELRTRERSFARWHYIRDPTHICFFSRDALRRLAALAGGKVEFGEKKITVFTPLK